MNSVLEILKKEIRFKADWLEHLVFSKRMATLTGENAIYFILSEYQKATRQNYFKL